MTRRTKTINISAATAADAKAWATRLGCTVAELRIAVRAVGSSLDRVRAYLDALNSRTPPKGIEPNAPDQPILPTTAPDIRLPHWPASQSSER
ncbi:DUF3606 domain-containing protein [Variovorax paradoxus]|uniref:DUF3606 domain-containing protein n=1 Tax=Variovorax TaxID=34072 RepID=UPI000B889AA3